MMLSTSTATDVVRARVEPGLKSDATEVLNDMGLNMSVAINLFLLNVVAERKLPFPVKVPNRKTRAAMKAAEHGDVHYADDLKDIIK